MIGGYQIIDLLGKELNSGVGMVFDGIYDAIEASRKPIMIEGLNIGGTEYKPCFVEFIANGSNYETEILGKNDTIMITVSDIDVVTVTVG